MIIRTEYSDPTELPLIHGKNDEVNYTINFGSDLVNNNGVGFDDVLIFGRMVGTYWPGSGSQQATFNANTFYNGPLYVFGCDSGTMFNYGLIWELSEMNSGTANYQYQYWKMLTNITFSSGTSYFGPVSIANKFGGVMPQFWGVFTKSFYNADNDESYVSGPTPIKKIWYQGIRFTNE